MKWFLVYAQLLTAVGNHKIGGNKTRLICGSNVGVALRSLHRSGKDSFLPNPKNGERWLISIEKAPQAMVDARLEEWANRLARASAKDHNDVKGAL